MALLSSIGLDVHPTKHSSETAIAISAMVIERTLLFIILIFGLLSICQVCYLEIDVALVSAFAIIEQQVFSLALFPHI
jgi:hypothetical protein